MLLADSEEPESKGLLHCSRNITVTFQLIRQGLMSICCPSSITSREGHQNSPQRSLSCTSKCLRKAHKMSALPSFLEEGTKSHL